MLCAMTRRAPATFAAAIRLRVPSMRSRAFVSAADETCAGSDGRSVSWWITISGRASSMTLVSAAASNTSTTTGRPHDASICPAFAAERVVPVTS